MNTFENTVKKLSTKIANNDTLYKQFIHYLRKQGKTLGCFGISATPNDIFTFAIENGISLKN